MRADASSLQLCKPAHCCTIHCDPSLTPPTSYLLAQMLLVDNMVHSDLHPGNILVRLDPPWGTQTLCDVITGRLGLQARPCSMFTLCSPRVLCGWWLCCDHQYARSYESSACADPLVTILLFRRLAFRVLVQLARDWTLTPVTHAPCRRYQRSGCAPASCCWMWAW